VIKFLYCFVYLDIPHMSVHGQKERQVTRYVIGYQCMPQEVAHIPPSPPSHTHTPKLITLTCSSPQLLATLRSECTIPPPECFKIDQADSTQEVKKVTVTEAGPAHSMEQVNPQHLGTYVHYTSCHVFTAKHHYTAHCESLLVCVAICIYSWDRSIWLPSLATSHSPLNHSINTHGTWCYSIKYNIPCTMEGHRAAAHTHTHMVCCIQLSLCVMHSTMACCHLAWSQLGEQSNWQPTRGEDDSSDPRNRNEAHYEVCLPSNDWFWCPEIWLAVAGQLQVISSISSLLN